MEPSYRHGRLLCSALRGAWRQQPEAPQISEAELRDVTPHLLRTGEAPLVWWRLQSSELRHTGAAAPLREAWLLQILANAIVEARIQAVFRHLDSYGLQPLLLKGWSTALAYPERGLRPYGDIDLCFLPEQYAEAQAALQHPSFRDFNLDVHCGNKNLEGKVWDKTDPAEIFSRAREVPLGEALVRILSLEDHLRLICLHMLGHGAFRPLWLCDVAATVESLPANFDWDRCTAAHHGRSDWVPCSVGLAHVLLGMRLDGCAIGDRARQLPAWLEPAVVRCWDEHRTRERTVLQMWRERRGVLEALHRRWPNPLRFTHNWWGPLARLPRWRLQVRAFSRRMLNFARQLPDVLKRGE